MRSLHRPSGPGVAVKLRSPRPTKKLIVESLWPRVFVLVCLLEVLSVGSYAAGECSAVSFKVAGRVLAGLGPTALAAQDFNGDGHLDMAVANNESSNVSILLGDGAGSFGAAANYAVGSHPTSISAGDFNGDGKADLVTTNYDSANVSVLLGTGAGTFGGAINYATDPNPYGLALGDFNGDSLSDIAVGITWGGNTVEILLGNGAGGFNAAAPIAAGGRAYKIITGKFNGDGILDLALGMENMTAVFLGNGAGGFNAASPLPHDFNAMATGDFNGDGKADLVGANGFANGIAVLLGDGAGNFSAPVVSHGVVRDGMTVDDFNGDGKSDVAALDDRGGVLILHGDGTGQLGAPIGYSISSSGSAIVSADFNADGRLDLAAASRLDAVSMLYGLPGGDFAGALKFNVGPRPEEIVVADFNRDGKEDLAVVNTDPLASGQVGALSVSILLGDGAGRMAQATSIQFSNGVTALHSLVTADFNNDGKADLAVASRGTTDGVNVVRGNGDGTFGAPTYIALDSYGRTPIRLVNADVNRDGMADIIVLFAYSPNFATLLGTGAGNFNILPGSEIGASNAFEDFAVGDFNQDSNLDLVFPRYHDKLLVVVFGEGNGYFGTRVDHKILGNPLSVAVQDFNRDGKADLAFTHTSVFGNYDISVRLGDGAGGFGMAVGYSVGEYAQSITTGDFNGDNLIDIVVSNSGNGNVSVLSGDGAGAFGLSVPFMVGGAGSSTAADFNRDGKTDLAVSRSGANSVAILLNDFSAPRPCLSVNDVAITEGDSGTSNASFNVLLSEASDRTVKVNFHVEPRFMLVYDIMHGVLSTPGVDYQPVSGTLTFAPGTLMQTINVPINGDLSDEYDEGITLVLSSPTNAVIHDPFASATIFDNDAPPTISIDDRSILEGNSFFNPNKAVFTVSLSQASGKHIDLQYELADGTATASSDYRGIYRSLAFSPGTATQTIVVESIGDGTYEPDETFFVNLSNSPGATVIDAQGQGTIINDDPLPSISVLSLSTIEGNTGTTDANVTVQLSNPSHQTITVNYMTADGTAIAGSDYISASGSLTFNPGESSKLIKVPIVGDTIDESDETFNVILSGAVNAAQGNAQSLITLFDNDGPNITVNDISVIEGDLGLKNATFTVTLSAPSPDIVRVSHVVSLSGGTAANNIDYVRTGERTIEIHPGQLSATFNVQIIGDFHLEPDETLLVVLFNASGGTITDSLGVCTILNDDATGTLEFSAPFYSFKENSAAFVNVNRIGGRSGALSATFYTSDGTATAGSDYTAVRLTIIFADGDTDSKRIMIPLTDDLIVESAETINVALDNPPDGTILANPASAVLTILDNDNACGYAISPSSKTSPAAGETTTVNVTAQADCNWTAVSNSNFISVASGASGTGNGVVTLNVSPNGSGVPRTGTVTIAEQTFTIIQPELVPQIPTLQFGASSYVLSEADERVSVTVTRTGSSSSTAWVDYRTVDADTFTDSCADTTNNKGAFARCDFSTSVGRLDFAVGETQKTITVPVINDGHAEGAEDFRIVLSNPVGVAILGEISTTTVTVLDNDSIGTTNPIVTTPFFVRQHYLDFLSREPEADEPWSRILQFCPNPFNLDPNNPSAVCDRIIVSQSFLGSPEFSVKGFYAFRFYKLAFNRLPEYTEIVSDMSFVAGATEAEVYARKAQLADAFTQRQEFQTAYGGMSNFVYVAALLSRHGLTRVTTLDPRQPDGATKLILTQADLISRLDTNALTRWQVLRAVADSDEVGAREFDNAFVAMQYYGYLRRKPEAAGYEAWLAVLKRGHIRTMVDGFMNSAEYKLRFGRL